MPVADKAPAFETTIPVSKQKCDSQVKKQRKWSYFI